MSPLSRAEAARKTFIVERNVDEIGCVGVRAHARDWVFRNDLYLGFHGGAACVGYFRIQYDKIADFDRFAEDERVHGNGDDSSLRVAHTSERAGFVNKLHDPAAVNITMVIGVFWLH